MLTITLGAFLNYTAKIFKDHPLWGSPLLTSRLLVSLLRRRLLRHRIPHSSMLHNRALHSRILLHRILHQHRRPIMQLLLKRVSCDFACYMPSANSRRTECRCSGETSKGGSTEEEKGQFDQTITASSQEDCQQTCCKETGVQIIVFIEFRERRL